MINPGNIKLRDEMCALKDRLESFKASSASSTSELQNQLLSAKDEVIVKYTSRTNSRRTVALRLYHIRS